MHTTISEVMTTNSATSMTWISQPTSQSTSATDKFGQDTKTVSIMLLGTDPDREPAVVNDSEPCLVLARPPPTPRRRCIPLPSQASSSEKPAILHPVLQHPPAIIDLALPWTDVLQIAAASPLLWAWNNLATSPPLPSLAIIVKSTSHPIVVFPSLGRAYVTVGDILQRVWERLRIEGAIHIPIRFLGFSEVGCDAECWILEIARRRSISVGKRPR
ncbi:hypothetical protein BDZ89DRAFT_1078753 [Hymenopellis radicata]|nr:hypothetical protein BDZ89DRAFT_1078753 [Hymenopellis radicata]